MRKLECHFQSCGKKRETLVDFNYRNDLFKTKLSKFVFFLKLISLRNRVVLFIVPENLIPSENFVNFPLAMQGWLTNTKLRTRTSEILRLVERNKAFKNCKQ